VYFTSNDYFQIDNGFLNGRTGWINGDFDYDGVVTSNDYFLIDNAFLGQGAPLIGGSGSAALAAVAVPEPGVLSVAAAALTLLGMRRRRV
jgi:hypothetical protein